MADKIKIRRGLFADIPILDEGEFGLVTDRNTIYIGTESNGNILINPVQSASDGYTLDGYLYPAIDNVHGLGTPDKRWQSVSIGPGSLHIISKDTDPGYSVNSDFKIGIDSTSGVLQVTNGDSVLLEVDPDTGVSFAGAGSNDPVSVKSFGAVGDGVTDDTSAIQAAIDYVKALPRRGRLYIPTGHYKFTNLNLTKINSSFDATMTISGDGPECTLLEQTIPATGVAIDMSGTNYMHLEDIGLFCGPNSDIGILLARYVDAPNCNLNTFTRVWVRSSASIASLVAIAAESTTYNNCWFDVGGAQAVFIGESNAVGAVSAYGTIQQSNSNIENHFYACRFSVNPGNACVRLTDGCGVEFIGCATYNLTNAGPLTAHFIVDNPTNADGASWPTRIDHHLFEGIANTGVLFKAASHGNGAVYQYFHITNSWMSMNGSWVDIDMSDQGASQFGIIHEHFLFRDNASAPGIAPGSITLNVVEHSYISHQEEGATVNFQDFINACTIYVPSAGLTTNGISCSIIEYMNAAAADGYNFSVFGGSDGRFVRFPQLVPTITPPNAEQISTGMIVMADPSSWDPASVGGSTPYPAFYDGVTFRAMTGVPDTGGTFIGNVYFTDGSSTFPGISFSGAHGTGIHRDGTTLNFDIDGHGTVAYVNQFGVFSCQYVAIGGANAFMNSGGSSIVNFTDVSDVGAAGVHCAYEVSSPGSSDSPSVRVSRRVYTNSGAGSEFAVVLPSSANIGSEYTCYDVGGTGGISFIAPTGESIRVGLSVTSSTNRKVKCTDGAGAELTLVKLTSTLWMQKGGFVGTWVGS